MTDHALGRKTMTLQPLSPQQWADRFERAVRPLPFGHPSWIEFGLAERPGLMFTPVLVDGFGEGSFLVPLCRLGDQGQIGAFGYGAVYPQEAWDEVCAPPFHELAAVVCEEFALAGLRALLAPASIDGSLRQWPGAPVKQTYLLNLSVGQETIWSEAKGRMRTSVRRAERHGVVAEVCSTETGAVFDLHAQTMLRNDAENGLLSKHIHGISSDGLALTVLARGERGVCAASVFALGVRAAYHVMQSTSDEGRATNAGYLSFWTALTELMKRGFEVVDLGSATSDGQARFKADWGGRKEPARLATWRKGP
jgi:hypothetical protein